jgi:hypothetical protein
VAVVVHRSVIPASADDVYDTGYAPDVRKHGGYAAYESGYLRRHVVGYTTVKQGALTERSVVTVTNVIPAGQRFFAYQAAEFEVKGPAQGTAEPGLSYFLTNLRLSLSSRVELNGTYNLGRSLDARQLTTDLLNGRALTAQTVEGLHYESTGGRLTVEVAPRVRLYAGYTRDRTNRDDTATGRVLVGGHAANAFGTGSTCPAPTRSSIDRRGAHACRLRRCRDSRGPGDGNCVSPRVPVLLAKAAAVGRDSLRGQHTLRS